MTHEGHGATIVRSLPLLSVSALGLAMLAGALAYAFRGTLFGQSGPVFPVLTACVTAGSLFVGLVRGALAARGRYLAAAVSLVGENAFRVVAAVGIAAAGGGAELFGLALVFGPLVCLVWVGSLRFARTAPGSALRSPLALMSGVAGGSLLAQVVLTGAPVVLAVTGGEPAVATSLFVALAVWRAPYIVALGVTPQITAYFTGLVAAGQVARVVRIRAVLAVGVAVGAAAAALVGANVMGSILAAAFGHGVRMSDAALAALGSGTVAALGNVVLMLLLLALGRARSATLSWVAAVAVSTLWMVLSSMAPSPRVVVAFVLAQATAFTLLFLSSRQPR
ncbi:hypothetical protein ABN034_32810 [Actinopolymorpha sp. B11F2]|uniref:hypothetical protein n=1 Tax=Actinopolymorpha sp. B11F2 TaxID=3160862 RepID=UPI0032E5245E